MKRKILALALACMMLVSVLPTSVFAAEAQVKCPGTGKDHNKENCEYTLIDDVASVCGEIGYKLYECNACKDHFADDLYKDEGSHSWTPATCTTPKTCSVCKKTDGKALDHKYVDGEVDCVNGGEAVCSVCGDKKTLPADGHEWCMIPEIITKPTLETAGEAKYTCEDCGATKNVVIEKACGHNLVHHKAVEAKCYAPGHIEYWECVECGVYYASDVAVKENKITKIETTAEHNMVVDTKKTVVPTPACKEEYTQYLYCQNKGCEHTEEKTVKQEHNPGSTTVTVPPTCTEWGGTFTLCKDCGAIMYGDKDGAIPPLGHTEPEATAPNEADLPTVEVESWGELTLNAVNSLIVEDGSDGNDFFFTAPHDGVYVLVVSANEDNAYPVDYCWSTCDCFYSLEGQEIQMSEGEYITISMGTYDENADSIEVVVYEMAGASVVEPTCTEDGLKVYECTVCGEKIEEVLKATGHSGTNGALEVGYKDATCITPYYLYYYCTHDDCIAGESKSYNKYTLVDEDTKFFTDLDVTVWDEEAEAYVPVYVHKTDAEGKVDDQKGSYIHFMGEPSTDWDAHNWAEGETDEHDSVIINYPTHTTTGSAFGFCLDCKKYIDAKEIPVLEYEWDDGVIIPASCAGDGYTLYTCTCDYCAKQDEPATKKENITKYEPKLQYNLTDAKAEHNLITNSEYYNAPYYGDEPWYETFRNGGCITVGLNKYYCKDCEQYILVIIEGTGEGHKVPDAAWFEKMEEEMPGEYWAPKDPTCTEDGTIGRWICAVEGCNHLNEPESEGYWLPDYSDYIKEWEVIPALKHDFSITVAEQKATCEEGGWSAHKECARCGEKNEDYVKYEAIKHANEYVENARPASCLNFQFVHWICPDCGREYINNYHDALGHAFTKVDHVEILCEGNEELGLAPGKYEVYYCQAKVCKQVHYKLVKELNGHVDKNGNILGNCVNAGHCVNCDQDIAKHPNTEIVINPGNCIVNGVELVICSDCLEILSEKEIESTIMGKHDWDKEALVPTYAAGDSRTCKVCGKIETVDALKGGFNAMMTIDNNVAGVGFADSSLVKIVVSLESFYKVNAHTVNFELKYDNKVVYFEGAKFLSENFVVNPLAVDNAKDGVVKVIASVNNDADKKAQNFEIADHDLVELYFRINNATATETSFAIEKVEALDKDVKAVNCAGSTASIKIQKFLDVDADGDFTLADVLTAYKMWNKELDRDYDVTIDVDKDGVITAADVLALYQYKVGALTYKQIIAMGVTSTAPEVKPEEKPENPSEPVEKMYYISSPNANGALYLTGTVTKGRLDATADKALAVKIGVENGAAEGTFYLYFMNGEVKTYIGYNPDPSSKTAAFVLVENTADENCLWKINENNQIEAVNFAGRAIGTQNTSTYENMSTYATSNTSDPKYSWATLVEA